MSVGISTSCFYPRTTEDSLRAVGELGAPCTEIFINAPTELRPAFMDALEDIRKAYGLRVTSFHTYASFTESYYYFSAYERRFTDSLEDFKRYFYGMGLLGAKFLVLHGAKIPGSIPDEQVFERFGVLADLAETNGVTLCQENVVRYRSESPEYMKAMRAYLGERFHMVLDIKQAWRTGVDPYLFAEEFAREIVHIHISDYTDAHDCVVPFAAGTRFDFPKFFSFMQKKGYRGDYMLELYADSFRRPDEIRFAREQLEKCL